ncbi:hypothetical protein BDF20DRAFT_177117 [Mycotypha africana]|uniref:uncharacterized protein n=1 Tax=Mycotypha africana TaxID=64632 RepID=UPI002301CC0A|nr:uncharacterized protein BDF20DRAFT_177117 [Mycotypha africana]KAI8968362.1 hypothetical protein BDF20DRAFT_177117 [Mycotypha africana]
MPIAVPEQPQMFHYPAPNIPENYLSNPNSRRSSAATTVTNRSSKSSRDRRRSSGALSTHSQQKPRKCIGDYIVGKTLGKGASGRVKLGVHRMTGEQVAIKIISKAHLAANPAIEKAVRREIAIMKLINHPNVMSLTDVIDDPSSSDLHLVLEYVEGGELFEYLVSKGRLDEAEARHHFQQIILGLDYCHHHLICHRDLKPENLLLDSKNNIKIADFGMASLQPLGSMLETSCGSPHYASPEIVAGLPYNGSACDIWSCGVILYALLTGHLPFDDENIRQLLRKVKSGKYTMPDNISVPAQDLIRRILVVDPSKRLNMQQIMSHPWFRETPPLNISTLPVPPTEKEIGRPVHDASEIDDRILETIKFLWSESSNENVIRALLQKEHNMQKVVYVLLKQHAERYWQADHADESDEDEESSSADPSRRRYRTITHRSDRDRKSLSMLDAKNTTASTTARRGSAVVPRPSAPWLSNDAPFPPTNSSQKDLMRRHSAATVRTKLPVINTNNHPAQPPLPALPLEKPSKMKKSETFYTRFVKSVLSSSRKQQSKEPRNTTDTFVNKMINNSVTTTSAHAAAATPGGNPSKAGAPALTPKSGTSTLVGTLRRKNPFHRTAINTTDFAITSITHTTSTKGTVRPASTILQRNRIDPSEDEDSVHANQSAEDNQKSASPSRHATLQAKRMSLRIPNAFKGVNDSRFGFTLGSNARKQRKQVDISMFGGPASSHKDALDTKFEITSFAAASFQQQQQQQQQQPPTAQSSESSLLPPPALSDGSTLSSSSSTCSSSHSNIVYQTTAATIPSPVVGTPTVSAAVPKNYMHRHSNQNMLMASTTTAFTTTTTTTATATTNNNNNANNTARRASQVSFKSVDRRGSNISTSNLSQQHINRPITPSLLSNSSTIATSNVPILEIMGSKSNQSMSVHSTVSSTQTAAATHSTKASWLNHLFFFKQPKVCSLTVYSTDTVKILKALHQNMNQFVEARFYEKSDRAGTTRYKVEILWKPPHGTGKLRQVKCRIELLMMPDAHCCLVQLTQQQGDALVLSTTMQQMEEAMTKEFPPPSPLSSEQQQQQHSFKELNSVITSANTLVENDD